MQCVGGWQIRCKSCRWHIMCIGLITTGRSGWLHRDLLPTPYFQQPGWFKETRETTYFSAEEDDCSYAAHGTRGGCPFPYSRYGSSHHHALGPIGREAKNPKAGRAFPQTPEQELVLTQLLAVSTCCWCRNNPSHDAGAAFVRYS